ncbi:hypothetical protein MKK88_01800 [Methylobacterium sp. E-005]|uniref:hypothetical protein n=1 Tax=Methylobacterium sp. E-005 TaxID=2836549 RepID=UPI001FB873B7|nr:hypothetical protein [Methylobacterium sp. E-005]MCJ2084728.1 hypothetical protein [Methylobacterium sp. E-005]
MPKARAAIHRRRGRYRVLDRDVTELPDGSRLGLGSGRNLAPAGFLSYLYGMLMPIEGTPKKRGRPATGKDPVTSIRLSPEMRAEIDAWSDRQPDRPKRSEAIRRLVEEALRATRV